jgi:hypothetical protein
MEVDELLLLPLEDPAGGAGAPPGGGPVGRSSASLPACSLSIVGVDADGSVLNVTASPTASDDNDASPFLSMSLLDVTAYVFPSMVTLFDPTAVTVPLFGSPR